MQVVTMFKAGRMQLLRMGVILFIVFLQACATGDRRAVPEIQYFGIAEQALLQPVRDTGPGLKVMTFNMAHGRGDSFHQLLQSTETTRANLDAFASMLTREQPDVVALQEADGASFWSGNFNHLAYLAERSPHSWAVNGRQVQGAGLSYGTALLSSLELQQPQAVTFDPALSMIRKGFVISSVDWPGQPGVRVDVVSVHLDFSSEFTRRLQARELIAELQDRGRPVIVMGDLNTDWQHEDSTVRLIAGELGLSAYSPDGQNLETFPWNGKRLDWILLSGELSFHSYRVMSDVLSDHRGVVAEVILNPQPVSLSSDQDMLRKHD
jgi:endonuclease/exonuclease/phosphatase family metal-dependent hydrolase